MPRRSTQREPMRPGEWLEHSPVLNVLIAALGGGWLVQEFATKGASRAISNLNTYNFLFLMLGLLLCWRPRVFLDAAARGVPSVTGVLIQFPLLRRHRRDHHGCARRATVQSIAHHLSTFFARGGDARELSRRDGHLLRGAGVLRALRRRQVDHRSAVRDAGGERAESAPGLGGAGLQRGRSAAEPDQSVLDAAAAGHTRAARRATSSASRSCSSSCTCRWCCCCCGCSG